MDLKCFFCGSSVNNIIDKSSPRVRVDFLKKLSILCGDCQDKSVSSLLIRNNELMENLSINLETIKINVDENNNRVFTLENKIGLLTNHVTDLISAIDVIDKGVAENTRSIAGNGFDLNKTLSKTEKLINNFDTSLHEVVTSNIHRIEKELQITTAEIANINKNLVANTMRLDNFDVNIGNSSGIVSESVLKLLNNFNNLNATHENKKKNVFNSDFGDNDDELQRSSTTRRATHPVGNTISLHDEMLNVSTPYIDNVQPTLTKQNDTPSTSVSNKIGKKNKRKTKEKKTNKTKTTVTVSDNGTSSSIISQARLNNIGPSSSDCSLRVVSRPRSIFTTRYYPETTSDEVVTYLRGRFPNFDFNKLNCKKISKCSSHVASFKITVPDEYFSHLLAPTTWPSGVFSKEFTTRFNVGSSNTDNKHVSVKKN